MIVYRLSHRFALEKNPHPFVPADREARWNSEGVRVAYASEHPALAAMELLTYWSSYRSMDGYRLFSAVLSEDDIEHAPETVDARDHGQTRPFGDAWVAERRSLALRVPSVVVPLSFNCLVNPAHPRMASFTYTTHGEFLYDARVADLVAAAKSRPS